MNYLSASDYQMDMWRLAASIRSAGWKPDLLVALWRGGAPVGISVHEFLKATGWAIEHIPLKAVSYSAIGHNEGDVVFTHGELVFGMLKPGDKVLVVDDVFDTGKTAAAVKAKIDAAGAEMRMACVYWKPEKNTTDLKPDYFVRDAGLDWLVFPHEIDGLSDAEIAEKNPTLAKLIAESSN